MKYGLVVLLLALGIGAYLIHNAPDGILEKMITKNQEKEFVFSVGKEVEITEFPTEFRLLVVGADESRAEIKMTSGPERVKRSEVLEKNKETYVRPPFSMKYVRLEGNNVTLRVRYHRTR